MLLAGVAALALIAGAGVASAQQNPRGKTESPGMSDQRAMPSQTAKPSAAAGMGQHAQTGPTTGAKSYAKTGSAAALNTKGANQPSTAQKASMSATAQKGAMSAQSQKSAQEINRTKIGNRHEHLGANREPKRGEHERVGANAKIEHNRSTARNERQPRGQMSTARRNERSRMNTAERNERNLKGLQGNASIPMRGGHVALTPEQRTRIRETVIDSRNAPRVGHVDFDIRVGTLVPRREIHVIPVPRTLVEIDPVWRGYFYFVARDEVIIVNPRDMRIVAVLPA
jgi:hypothetical protein